MPILIGALAACGGGESERGTDAQPAVAVFGAQSGEQLYQLCATCHGAQGEGTPGVFPPLAGSEYVTTENLAVPIRILLHGMQGPVTVRGVEYNGVMPPFGIGVEMPDADVAPVLTYVRQAWGNAASAVTAQDVAAERAATASQRGPVTADQLQPLM